MNPIFIKLLGAVIGSFLADTANKKLTTSKNARITQTLNAKIVPKETDNDAKDNDDPIISGDSVGADSGVSDKPNDPKPKVIDNESDQ